jgi:hypothetical protein
MIIPDEIEMVLKNQYRNQPFLIEAFHSLCENLGRNDPPIYGHLKKTARYVAFYNHQDVPFAYVDCQRSKIKFGIFEEDLRMIGNHPLQIVAFPKWSNRRNAKLVGINLISNDSNAVSNLAKVLSECYTFTPDPR